MREMRVSKRSGRGVILAGCEHTEGAAHDCAHVEFRDALVPVAAAAADARLGAEPPAGASQDDRRLWSYKWDALYHREMRRLTGDPFVLARVGASPGAPAFDFGVESDDDEGDDSVWDETVAGVTS